MFDNMTIDEHGRVFLQEDVGSQAHSGKIWMYDIATDELVQIAQHDPARFGDLGVPATAPFNQDEESSGIIDVSDILGPGTFLLDVQAHYNPGDAGAGRGRAAPADEDWPHRRRWLRHDGQRCRPGGRRGWARAAARSSRSSSLPLDSRWRSTASA